MAGLTRSVAPILYPVTLDEVKDGLRIVITEEDDFIESLLYAAIDDAENILHRAILPQTWILLLDQFPAGQILLPYAVAKTVTVAYQALADVWTTLAASEVSLIAGPPSYVIPAYGKSWPSAIAHPDSVRITYTANSWATVATVPAGIKQWIIARVGELYEQREASGEVTLNSYKFIRGLLSPYIVPDYQYQHG